MKNKGVVFIVQGAMIAALYVVLTMLANALGLSSYSIQIRFSEALCILPFFTPAAIPGLWIGCLIANLMTGAIIWDIIFGSIHFPGIIRNTKSWINQDHSSHIIFSVCCSQGTYKTALALSKKENVILVYEIHCFHKVHNST